MSASARKEIWRFQTGASDGYDYAYGVSADAEGSFFLAGNTDGTFGGSNEGDFDMVVAKIDSDGSLVWSWQEGSDKYDHLECAAAVDDGGVVVAGYTLGSYAGVVNRGMDDFVAIKLDSKGAVEWRWQDGTEKEDMITGCSMTADGNVVLVGFTNGDWYGTRPGASAIIAVKLDVDDGSVLWRYQEGVDDYFVSGWAVGARSDGSVVLGGRTQGEWDGELAGTTDFMAVALDEDGAELWRWQDGPTSGDNKITGIAILRDDSTVLVGYTEGSYFRDNEGGRDFVVIKLTPPNGTLDWGWQGGTAFDDEFEGVATEIGGSSVIMGGYTYGSWAEINDADEEEMDFAAMSMDAGGDVLWEYQSGTLQGKGFNDVAVRPDGAVLLAGWTYDEFESSASTNFNTDVAGVLIKTRSYATSSSLAPTAAPPTFPRFDSSAAPTHVMSPATPSASSTLQPFILSPSSCGATESFRITSGDIPEIQGCFQATEESFANEGSTFEVWTTGGDLNFEQVMVIGFAEDGTGQYSMFTYFISFLSENDDDTVVYCYSIEDAITVHPIDATWLCDPDGLLYTATSDVSLDLDCGCHASPTPTTDPSVSDSSVPLGAVIGGSVGGLVLVAISGFLIYRHRTRTRSPATPIATSAAYPTVAPGGIGAPAVPVATAFPVKGADDDPLYPPPPTDSDAPPPYGQ